MAGRGSSTRSAERFGLSPGHVLRLIAFLSLVVVVTVVSVVDADDDPTTSNVPPIALMSNASIDLESVARRPLHRHAVGGRSARSSRILRRHRMRQRRGQRSVWRPVVHPIRGP